MHTYAQWARQTIYFNLANLSAANMQSNWNSDGFAALPTADWWIGEQRQTGTRIMFGCGNSTAFSCIHELGGAVAYRAMYGIGFSINSQSPFGWINGKCQRLKRIDPCVKWAQNWNAAHSPHFIYGCSVQAKGGLYTDTLTAVYAPRPSIRRNVCIVAWSRENQRFAMFASRAIKFETKIEKKMEMIKTSWRQHG